MASEKILSQKKAYVSELKDTVLNSSSGVLVDYKGITVEDDTKLRRDLREANVNYFVVKNSMLHLAIQDTELADLDGVLTGTTALAISSEEDALAAARILSKYAEASKGKFAIKMGYMDGKVLDHETVDKLAKMPNRDTLLSMLLSAITGNLRGLAVAINAIAEKNSEGEVATAE